MKSFSSVCQLNNWTNHHWMFISFLIPRTEKKREHSSFPPEEGKAFLAAHCSERGCSQGAEARWHRSHPGEVFLEGKNSRSFFNPFYYWGVSGTSRPWGHHKSCYYARSCTPADRHSCALLSGMCWSGKPAHRAGVWVWCQQTARKSSKGVIPTSILISLLHTLAITRYCRPFILAILAGFSLWVKFTFPWRLAMSTSFHKFTGHLDFIFPEMPWVFYF